MARGDTNEKTGYWYDEMAAPYYRFVDARPFKFWVCRLVSRVSLPYARASLTCQQP